MDHQLFCGSCKRVRSKVNGTRKVSQRTIVPNADVLLDKKLGVFR